MSRTRNVTRCHVGAFQNMLVWRRDLPLCSWDKWVDQLSLLLLWTLCCICLLSCFLWAGILLSRNFQPRIFLEISILSAYHTLQRSDVFLEGFQLLMLLSVVVWVCFFLGVGEGISVVLSLIYILILCKQRQRKNRNSLSVHLMLLCICLDPAPSGLRDTFLTVMR